jgi:hypothetical protein
MKARDERGWVLPGILLGMFVMGGLVYSTSMISRAEVERARNSLDDARTLCLARSGLEHAIHELRLAAIKTACSDPLLGVRNLFRAANDRPWMPFRGHAVHEGNHKIGEFSVAMRLLPRQGGLDVTVRSTGHYPAAPENLPAGYATRSRTLEAVVRIEERAGSAFGADDGSPAAPIPRLWDLARYEALARAQRGEIRIGNERVCNAVHGDEPGESGNLFLRGTAAAPIEVRGVVVARGNLIVTGQVIGSGAIYCGRNLYVPGGLSYGNPGSDLVGLFARENLVVGDHLQSGWRSWASAWLQNAPAAAPEDAGEDQLPGTRDGADGVPNTADDDLLEGDGQFTTLVYTPADEGQGLIPPGRKPGDRVPGSGEDVDGDGTFDPAITLEDLDFDAPLTDTRWGGNIPPGGVAYAPLAGQAPGQLDGVLYAGRLFVAAIAPDRDLKVAGAVLARGRCLPPRCSLLVDADPRLADEQAAVPWLPADLPLLEVVSCTLGPQAQGGNRDR